LVDISVLVPVYRESQHLPAMLERLEAQKASKELIVTVDEPTQSFIAETRKFRNVKFIFNTVRVGKATALNEAVKTSSGRILLFLDADLALPDDGDFLSKIIEEMAHTDVLDIKKRVERKNFLSKMTYYEYFTFNISAWLASKHLRRCPAVNGAAFAIRREAFLGVGGFRKVVAEDIDIATRAFLKDYRFAYTKNVEVRNLVHSNWKSWFTQRKRWAMGQALWLKDWHRDLLSKCASKPQVFLPGVFFLYPSMMALFLAATVPSAWMYKSLWIFSFLLSVKFNIALPVFLVSMTMADLLKSLLISLGSFAATAILFLLYSRKLGFEIKLHELFIYYFFYSTLWLTIIITAAIKTLVFKKTSIPDWKT